RLLRQAEDEFKRTWEFIGDQESRIVRVDRSLSESELHSNSKTAFFCTVQSYYEMIKRQESLYKKLAQNAMIVVFDEAHKITASTYNDSVETVCYYSNAFLIGLSATPGRSTVN